MLLQEKAKRDTADTYLVNSNMLTKRIQDEINARRKLDNAAAKANKQPKTSRGIDNLTFSHMGVTNTLQSPCYYKSINRPSNSVAVSRLNASVGRQMSESR